MSLKTYTITMDGNDNGNVITQPFTIEVAQISSLSEGESSLTQVRVCTKNANGQCGNSDIADTKNYALQSMSSSANAVLSNTIEADLEAAYPGKWS